MLTVWTSIDCCRSSLAGSARRHLTLLSPSHHSSSLPAPAIPLFIRGFTTPPLTRRVPASRRTNKARRSDRLGPANSQQRVEDAIDREADGVEAVREPQKRKATLRPRSPSSTLIQALARSGHHAAVPPALKKAQVDHTYISAFELQRRKESGTYVYRTSYEETEHILPTGVTLQSILADYIDFCGYSQQNHEELGLLRVFNDASLSLLSKTGYNVEDVISWAWILTPQTSLQAALRLYALSNQTFGHLQKHVPTFVYLLLLRRPRITIPALRLLIAHGWDRLENRINVGWQAMIAQPEEHASEPLALDSEQTPGIVRKQSNYPVIDVETVVLLIIRLLRHAGRIWPATIPSIAMMLSKHIRSEEDLGATPWEWQPHETARMTFLFNRLLSLIGRFSSPSPFLSVAYQERAQFNIIRKMTEFSPPLIVNREGYKAIISVQLAHRKTQAERNWAYLQSKAWPPYREDKLGMDIGKGSEIGHSRADRALRNLKEAGYARSHWEDAAGILSGWDTDSSPTIQKRALLSPIIGIRPCKSQAIQSAPLNSLIWEARILATRTIDEAWACFLDYESRESTYPNVYAAMLQKIVFEEKRRNHTEAIVDSAQATRDHDELPVSGDMLEVEASSRNPREMTYTRVPSPNFEEFTESMLKNENLHTGGRLLCLMLEHAKTIDQGWAYLKAGNLPKDSFLPLAGIEAPTTSNLAKTHANVFTAVIKFLSRNAMQLWPRNEPWKISASPSTQRFAIMHAVDLLFTRKPSKVAPWNAVLSALESRNWRLSHLSSHHSSVDKDLDCWASLSSIVEQMEEAEVAIDFTTFHILCTKFEKMCRHLRLKGHLVESQKNGDGEESFAADAIEIVIRQGLELLKKKFKGLVSLDFHETTSFVSSRIDPVASQKQPTGGGYSASSLLPSFMLLPAPANIHAFMRVLGSARDDQGILDFLRWLALASPQLETVTTELRNGPKLFRLALIAARAYLERAWTLADEHGYEARPFEDPASPAVMDKAYDVVNSVKSWNGWPTDEEVFEYCRKGHWSF